MMINDFDDQENNLIEGVITLLVGVVVVIVSITATLAVLYLMIG